MSDGDPEDIRAAMNPRRKRPAIWSRLGAGLVTGASDDDPSGIGTYAQAGAAFGFQLAWTLLFSLMGIVALGYLTSAI